MSQASLVVTDYVLVNLTNYFFQCIGYLLLDTNHIHTYMLGLDCRGRR